SSINSSSGFAPFELNYGIMPTMFRDIPHAKFDGVRQFAQRALDNLLMAHDAIIESRVFQTHHANRLRRPDERHAVGQLVYLSTQN
ncbi:hypothetical protein BD410DRAFT_689819, partial [Rickenella mellea]